MADSLRLDQKAWRRVHQCVHAFEIFDGWVATIPSDMRDCLDVIKVLQALREVGFSADEAEDAM